MKKKFKFSFARGDWELFKTIKETYFMDKNEFICSCDKCGHNVNKEVVYEINTINIYKQKNDYIVIGKTTEGKTIVVNKELKEQIIKEVENGN